MSHLSMCMDGWDIVTCFADIVCYPTCLCFFMQILKAMSINITNLGGVVNYHDHHRDITINVNGANPADLLRAALAEDIEDVTPDFSSSVSSETIVPPVGKESHSEKEPRLKQLFDDPKRTEEESNRFLNFLSDHNISSRLIDSSQDNPILKAVVCFCVKWRNLRYIESKYSPSAVLRFLTDTCSLQTDRVADRAIANALGVMIKNGYDKVLYQDVCDYF